MAPIVTLLNCILDSIAVTIFSTYFLYNCETSKEDVNPLMLSV